MKIFAFKTNLQKLLQKLYPLLLTTALFVAIYLVGKNIPQESILSFINSVGPFAPIVFIIINLLTYIFAPLSGTPLLFAGFYVFGSNVIFLSWIAAIISSVINFWIARRWGRGLIEKFVGKDNMHKVDKFTQNYGLWTLVYFRIFGGGVHDFISYAAGLTNIKFRLYFIISTLAVIPGNILWYFLSQRVSNSLEFVGLTFFLIFISLAAFVIATFLIKKFRTATPRGC